MAAAKCIALLLLALAVGATHALPYMVTLAGDNGTDRFEDDVGTSYALRQLNLSTQFVWKTFAQESPTDRKNVTAITLLVQKEKQTTSVEDNHIYLNSGYVDDYVGDIKREVTGILYQEVTYIWQWDANGTAPAWWKGGVPAYIRIAADLAPYNWAKLGTGDSWEQGADVTARFIEYLETVTPGFVGKLNAKIKSSWDIGYFKNITRKSVDELWKDYKAKYAK